MIVKILSKSGSFSGVRYNSDKVEKDKGILMKLANFGLLETLKNPKPTDLINYLKMVSAANKKVRYPQFHAVISCKGREKSAAELTDLAEKWLREMGYGKNPYLLVFHKDTENNHVHMVSTRVGKDGKKIDDSFEKIRSYKALHKILEDDHALKASSDLEKILSYSFTTHAQFKLLAELKGYQVVSGEGALKLCKFGRSLASVSSAVIDRKISAAAYDHSRVQQLKAIMLKYQGLYDKELVLLEKRGGAILNKLSSPLTEHLSKQFGLEFIFHAKPGMPPYGYTLIDHSNLYVYKGGEILSLDQLIRGPEVEVSSQSSGSYSHRQSEISDRKKASGLSISGDVDDESANQRYRKKKRKQSR